ncbi:histidinol phosphatase [Gillisia sp. M10.2A]|uniref:protein-tyrosine-phosphatase n=1 Tax=Gillisia lutea TaxID=2909668 RepID=A0ABS9EIL1_9FLAO|nr:CpsB/CapC family capsule biosynthesis tyrosine phosphatase [Gillisia lutea]MCF4102685.1 histidinol phosphatase [Gillisia lutea]
MLSIFQKKEFLIDHLSGITDIHNHILPGIDDGAANVNETIGLLEKFNNHGINKFIATPHVMNDYYPNTPDSINAALDTVKESLLSKSDLADSQISVGAEYMMDQSFLDLLEKGELLTLKDNLVLVEMSYFQAPINLNEILFTLQTKGYKPVLAHPERYAYFHNKDLRKYEDLKSRGCHFQVNALSLSSHYGTSMQQIAYKLIEQGMIDFIGSDTHRIQHIEKLSSIQLKKKQLLAISKIVEKTKETF